MEFLVLPDSPAAAETVRMRGQEPGNVLRHHSGRPWLLGRWADDDVLLLEAGRNKAVFLGAFGRPGDWLRRLLGSARTTADLDALARALPGCFHFVATLDGRVRAQGSLSTACQIFFGQVRGLTVAADRPGTVAELAGAGVDEQALALRLLSPYGPPWPLNDECPWREVRSPPTGHYLTVARDGTGRTVRWWTPPEPDLPPARATSLLRQALADAVDARSTHEGVVSADLSGGMDSTSLCYLAAHQGVRLVTVHYTPLGEKGEDHAHATRCAEDLSGDKHLVVPPEATEEWYTDPETLAAADIEGPYPFDRSRPTVLHTAHLAAGAGSSRHLLGIGADELFEPSPRRGDRSYEAWLRTAADRLLVPWEWDDPISWEVEPKPPPWSTAETVRIVRERLRDAAAIPPLARSPARHQMIRLSLMNGAIVRRMSRVGAPLDVSFHAPYLDDRVLEAVLATPEAEQSGPVKPLLAAASQGIVPDTVLNRRTKGISTHEGFAFRRRWSQLATLCADSRLAGLGLVDPGILRAALRETRDDGRPPMPRDPTLACELWLRAVADHH